jgi:hypothetical protein
MDCGLPRNPYFVCILRKILKEILMAASKLREAYEIAVVEERAAKEKLDLALAETISRDFTGSLEFLEEARKNWEAKRLPSRRSSPGFKIESLAACILHLKNGRGTWSMPCACRKSNPNIFVVQSAKAPREVADVLH